ncbi:hypothetical protein ACHAWT_002458 [Skeletonema menzelii]
MASISSGSASFTQQQGAAAIRNYQRRRRQNEVDARMTAHQILQQQDDEEQQRLMYQRQLHEEDYSRRIASPGESSSSRLSRQQLVQRRLERRRQERRLRTTDLQSQTTPSQPINQPPPPPPLEKSPRSIMKKSSSYQTMSDQQQYFHNHQRQPQHPHNTSSNYSSDSSGNYISPPILNRKQPFPDGSSYSNSDSHNVFTQNGVVIDRTAFRPTINRLRLPHESPSDEWSRNGSPVHQSRNRRGQYLQPQQFQQHPQLYVPDTPSQNSGSYDAQAQMRGNIRQPNWQQVDQQRLMYQRQEAARHGGHTGQQQNVSYVSDDEDTYNNGRVNTSFNSHANTVKTQNRSRSLSKERQLPRRWRHNRAAASVGRGGMSQTSENTPLSAEGSPQFQYTPRSRLAVTESLGQAEVNTSMTSSQNGRHGWREQNAQQIQNQHQPPSSGYSWGAQDDRQSHQTHQNVVSPARSENSHFSDRDQESVSVASIRKSWEGRVEQQRGRTQDTSYHRRRDTGENQFGMWEGRDTHRASQLRQGEVRREQNRNIDSKWKRNSSLPPPERRRGGGLRHEEYSDIDGYQSDGGYRSQPERIEVDAAHVSIHDARRRLWDQEERLRAVLPQADSFDSYGDVRHRRPFPSVGLASPGNVSTLSTGSALFKSKFVHAAALATQKRDLPVDGGRQNFHYPNKREDESPKGSSQITDSTADTTAPSSNHTSHGENARKQPAQTTATMPSISEARPVAETTPQASVADLIARINAVSRDNPAEALARIDSIIKGESAGGVKPRQHNSGVSSLFNFDAAKKQAVASKRPGKGNVTNNPAAAPHVDKRFAFEGDDHDDDAHDDPSVDESVSSSESTVSSMTNPTYQSVHESRRRKSSNKHSDLEGQPSSPQVVTTRTKGAEKQTFADNREPRSNRVDQDGDHLTKAKLKSFDKNNDWTASAPQSDFFTDFGGFRNASTQAVASSKTMQIKKNSTWNESSTPDHEEKEPKRPATPDIMNAVSSAFSNVNISFGDAGATNDLLAKAFSDLDGKGKAQKQNAVTNAFSDVDISMEKKTVRQRRKELELLSKSMTGVSDDDAGNMNQNTSSAFDWDIDDPTPTKQKKKSEPTLRVKSNKKLTQKFANLVKAFEHF